MKPLSFFWWAVMITIMLSTAKCTYDTVQFAKQIKKHSVEEQCK